MKPNILIDRYQYFFIIIFFLLLNHCSATNKEKVNFDKSLEVQQTKNECTYTSIEIKKIFYSKVECKNGFQILAPTNKYDKENCFFYSYSIILNNQRQIKKQLRCSGFNDEKIFVIN